MPVMIHTKMKRDAAAFRELFKSYVTGVRTCMIGTGAGEEAARRWRLNGTPGSRVV